MIIGEATNTNFMFFGLTRLGLETTIYHTQDQQAKHYTTDALCIKWCLVRNVYNNTFDLL